MSTSVKKSLGLEIQAVQEPTRLYSVTEYGIRKSRVRLEITNRPSADNRLIVLADNRPMHYRCNSNYKLQQICAISERLKYI
jgi:hypothetical protein